MDQTTLRSFWLRLLFSALVSKVLFVLGTWESPSLTFELGPMSKNYVVIGFFRLFPSVVPHTPSFHFILQRLESVCSISRLEIFPCICNLTKSTVKWHLDFPADQHKDLEHFRRVPPVSTPFPSSSLFQTHELDAIVILYRAYLPSYLPLYLSTFLSYIPAVLWGLVCFLFFLKTRSFTTGFLMINVLRFCLHVNVYFWLHF